MPQLSNNKRWINPWENWKRRAGIWTVNERKSATLLLNHDQEKRVRISVGQSPEKVDEDVINYGLWIKGNLLPRSVLEFTSVFSNLIQNIAEIGELHLNLLNFPG